MKYLSRYTAALFAALVGFLLFGAADAAAQTYTRPSKGAPITIMDADTTPESFTSALYDWTAFEGAEVTIQVASGGAVTSFADCNRAIWVIGLEYATKTGTGFSINAANGSVILGATTLSGATTSFTYRMRIGAPYLKYLTGALGAGTGLGAEVCAWSIFVTPLPFLDNVVLLETGAANFSVAVTDAAGGAGFASTYGGVTQLGRTLYLENTGTALAYCRVKNTAVAVTTSAYGFTLAAAAVADDGSGGKISIPVPMHDVKCITGAGLSTTIKGFIR